MHKYICIYVCIHTHTHKGVCVYEERLYKAQCSPINKSSLKCHCHVQGSCSEKELFINTHHLIYMYGKLFSKTQSTNLAIPFLGMADITFWKRALHNTYIYMCVCTYMHVE